MHASWDMEYDRHTFFLLGHFLPFYPAIDHEKKKKEKM